MEQFDLMIRLSGVHDDLVCNLRHSGPAILLHSPDGNINSAQIEIKHGNDAFRPLVDTSRKAGQKHFCRIEDVRPSRPIGIEHNQGVFGMSFRAMCVETSGRYSIFKLSSLRRGDAEDLSGQPLLQFRRIRKATCVNEFTVNCNTRC